MKPLAFLALLLAAAPLAAAPRAVTSLAEEPPPRITTLVVFGDDPCPRSKDEEIVVCARQPESERYRIPKALRRKKRDEAAQSWVERARTLDMVSKRGLPNSCSPQGSNGQTGCMRQFLEAARAEREAEQRGE